MPRALFLISISPINDHLEDPAPKQAAKNKK
jgi:hypothetical protein